MNIINCLAYLKWCQYDMLYVNVQVLGSMCKSGMSTRNLQMPNNMRMISWLQKSDFSMGSAIVNSNFYLTINVIDHLIIGHLSMHEIDLKNL